MNELNKWPILIVKMRLVITCLKKINISQWRVIFNGIKTTLSIWFLELHRWQSYSILLQITIQDRVRIIRVLCKRPVLFAF